MIKAEDIMTKDVLTVTPDTPISIAVKILVLRKITGLPVVDKNNNLVGIISEKDLMGLLLDAEDVAGIKVEDLMTRDVKYFSPDDDAMDVCQFLLDNLFRRVPIVREGKLVGLVSRTDIMALVWRERFELKE